MAKTLTQLAIEKLKPGKNRYERPDAACPGLYVIVQPSGRKSFAVRTRFHGAPKKYTLKAVAPDIAAARAEARLVIDHARNGRDPKVEAERERAATFKSLCEDWIAKDQKGKASCAQVESIMERVFLPKLGERPVAGITRRDLLDVLRKEAERAPHATKVQTAVQRLFAWAASEDLIESNPARDLTRLFKSSSRERTLKPAELADVWHAAGDDDFGAIVRLLILTGARRSEVSHMRWSELDDALTLWTIPGERTKNRRPHEVPLSKTVRSILGTLKARTSDDDGDDEAQRDLVFGRGHAGFSGYSKCKERLDARVTSARAELRLGRPLRKGEKVKPTDAMPGWTLHDLRRTAATRMADIGVQPHVIEAVLNHVSGAKAKVAGIYNKAAYRKEKAEALSRWDSHVNKLVDTTKRAKVAAAA